MKKAVICILIIIVEIALLYNIFSCLTGKGSNSTPSAPETAEMKVISKGDGWQILIDTETHNEYIATDSDITPRMNRGYYYVDDSDYSKYPDYEGMTK